MLSPGSPLAALSGARLGAQPLDGRPGGRNERGLHYTTDGTLVDVWHWKSVRTGTLEQIDDDHFGPPLAPPENPTVLYTAGYTQDPKTAGGYTMTWDQFAEGTVQPRWLPRSPAVLPERMGTIDLDPAASDEGHWWLPSALMVEATPELEVLSIG